MYRMLSSFLTLKSLKREEFLRLQSKECVKKRYFITSIQRDFLAIQVHFEFVQKYHEFISPFTLLVLPSTMFSSVHERRFQFVENLLHNTATETLLPTRIFLRILHEIFARCPEKWFAIIVIAG